MEANNYKVSKKQGEKWFTYGNVKKNQFGNHSLGIKNTPEFKALVNSSAEWLNFSLFVEKDKPEYSPAVNQQGQVTAQEPTTAREQLQAGEMDDDQSIPF